MIGFHSLNFITVAYKGERKQSEVVIIHYAFNLLSLDISISFPS